MFRRYWVCFALVAIAVMPGCQAAQSRRASVAAAEPSLVQPGDSNIVQAPPPKSVTVVDRHPLLSKPRDYYEGAGTNKLVKVTAATVVGIPAGIVGELRQIVVGRPPEATY